MQKTVIVINGAGGVGKDTLCEMAEQQYRTENISSITPIKELAAQCGWQGDKTDRARRFLSDLKRLTVRYNDFPTRWLAERYEAFLQSDKTLMFVHIREPREIKKFVAYTKGAAKTLLVRGGARLEGRGAYGNRSDDDVEKYAYDYYFVNDQPLDKTETAFLSFLKTIVEE